MALCPTRPRVLHPTLDDLVAGGTLALAAVLLAAGSAALPVLVEATVAVAAGLGLRLGRGSPFVVVVLSVVLAHAAATLLLLALPVLPRFESEVVALVLALAFGLSRAFAASPSCRAARRCG